jgi:DNA polymerase-3 subunit alpha
MFIHLHLHSEYSLVDGIVGIKPLMKAVKANHMPAVAITDQCNLFAMVKFYRAALSAGIKPIVGAELLVHPKNNKEKTFRVVLLCQNDVGYKNLTRLISKAYVQGQQAGIPLVDKSWFTGATDGLIALSGGREGDIGFALLADQQSVAQSLLAEWQALFPNRFYIELQRTGRVSEEQYIRQALKLAKDNEVPVVATNDVRFLQREDFEAHEARVCIHDSWVLDDSRRVKSYSEEQYFRTEAEMVELFADIPSALANTVEIAKRCSLILTLGENYLPNFPVPEGISVDDYFKQDAEEGLEKRLTAMFDVNAPDFVEKRKPYDERLQREIGVIQEMGFTGYFLIVADFIRWAKRNKIFVGPGRGSGAGSLVAYALEITDVDSLFYDLLFERFLNPERVSVADFDIDFCMEGRDRVIEYVADKYGRESVAQIITYGTMAAKAVVRDVGRVLGYPYGFVDKIAKLVPFVLGMTLPKALDVEPQLKQRYDAEEEVKTLIDLALKLEGVPRNAGKHAGGVVIAPSVLTDFTPLFCEEGGDNRVTQFDKDDIEAVGLVKFDFLGLRTLTIMDWALQAINARRAKTNEPPIALDKLPLDDEKVFHLLQSCQTTAVFQLESRGIKELIHRLKPDCFDDVMSLVALYRPGPLQSGMADDFVNRKHGLAKVTYPHPSLEPLLKPSYGVIVYQDQVMQIAQVLAGYTLGGADILRRAMGKKKPEEMAKQREIFTKGAKENGVDEKTATEIFDIMEKFADYGFNKSHSAAYALLAYQTAWLKAHYPAEFMAAVLSSDMDNTDKVVRFIDDAQKIGITVRPPHINISEYKFTVVDVSLSDVKGLGRHRSHDNAPSNSKAVDMGDILYGLGAIKGVGQAAVESILAARKEKGPFKDLFTFCAQIDIRKANRKVLDALIRSGAMDCFGEDRAVLSASVDLALQTADQHSKTQNMKQEDLFGGCFGDDFVGDTINYVKTPKWSDEKRLLGEKETLGWYVSGHPIGQYEAELSAFMHAPITELKPEKGKSIITAGYVTALRVMRTKTGGQMALLTLEDRMSRIDLTVFPRLYETCRDLLVKDQLLVVEGEVVVDDFTEGNKLLANQVDSITTAREKFAKHLSLTVEQAQLGPVFLQQLKETLSPFTGGVCPVLISYLQNNATAFVALGEAWKVVPSEALLLLLRGICGKVEMVYE